jgi:hypothetical protein
MERRMNMVLMYENGKMRPVETILGMGEGEIKNDGGGEFNCYPVRTFVNVTIYPSTTPPKNCYNSWEKKKLLLSI